MLDLSQLEAELTRNESVDASAKLLLERLFAEFEANKNNPAAIQALVDRARSANDVLAAAVAANTPADTGGGDTGGGDTGGGDTGGSPV
jgi:hypothetical protein